MSIGSELHAARERKGLSMADIATATHTKVPVIEAIERDDFSSFAAPVYGKGFIRLYAQKVGLDPQPLLEQYGARTTGKRPSLMTEEARARARAATPPAAPVPAAGAEASGERPSKDHFDLFNAAEERAAPPPAPAVPTRTAVWGDRTTAFGELLREVWIRWTSSIVERLKSGTASAAEVRTRKDPWKMLPVVIFIIIVLIFVVSGLSRCARVAPDVSGVPTATAPGATVAAVSKPLRLAMPVPDPYFD